MFWHVLRNATCFILIGWGSQPPKALADLPAALEHTGAVSLDLTTGQLNGEIDMFCRGAQTFLPPCHHGQSAPPGGATFVPGHLFRPRCPLFTVFCALFRRCRVRFLAGFLRRFLSGHTYTSLLLVQVIITFPPYRVTFVSPHSLQPRCPCLQSFTL